MSSDPPAAGKVASTRPRGPAILHTALSLVLVIVLTVIALKTQQSPPPSVAEFAPQALDTISDAPDEQSRGSGAAERLRAEEEAARLGSTTSGKTPREVIEQARVRRCIGNPPRQIEDPQSPPCVPYYEGDNGGETWHQGVTRDEIRVAIPQLHTAYANDLANFFNGRFEFYGRQITIHPYQPKGAEGGTATMGADAEHVAEELGAFAHINYLASYGTEQHFYDELARRQVISVQVPNQGGPTATATQAHLQKHAPYQWNYLAPVDTILRNYAEFVCGSLAGRPPKYAGSPENLAAKRKFGVVFAEFSDRPVASPDRTPLRTGTSTCGVTWEEEPYVHGNSRSIANAVLQMKTAGVTSLLCLCDRGQFYEGFQPTATGEGYFPEWLISNYGSLDDDYAANFGLPADKNQASHTFGLMSYNKTLPWEDTPVYWAAKEMNPNATYFEMFNWPIWATYWNLLVLSSGIQMAGPNLTPHTLERALLRTRFPNPACGQPPYWQACVGFGSMDHTMINDFAAVWWDNTAQNVRPMSDSETRGGFCYSHQGKRWSLGNWKEEIPFFQGPCR